MTTPPRRFSARQRRLLRTKTSARGDDLDLRGLPRLVGWMPMSVDRDRALTLSIRQHQGHRTRIGVALRVDDVAPNGYAVDRAIVRQAIERLGRDFNADDANRAKLETDVAALARLMTPRRRASAKPKPAQKRRKPSNEELF
jgi:hypothetical protein